MSGIRVHTSSPINSNAPKATAPTPTTTARYPPQDELSQPVATPATTTASTAYLPVPPRPGAAAVPTPTATPFASQAPLQPTPTRPPQPSQTSSGPAVPQPGAVPSPFARNASPQRPSVPPPPKAGEAPQPASYYAPQYGPSPTASPQAQPYNSAVPLLPHQVQGVLNTPVRAQPSASTTDLSHPPGYVQNSHAAFDERPIAPYRPFESSQSSNRSAGGGILNSSPSLTQDGYEDGGVGQGIWDTARSWAKTAGEKLSQGEQEVWKAINGEK